MGALGAVESEGWAVGSSRQWKDHFFVAGSAVSICGHGWNAVDVRLSERPSHYCGSCSLSLSKRRRRASSSPRVLTGEGEAGNG